MALREPCVFPPGLSPCFFLFSCFERVYLLRIQFSWANSLDPGHTSALLLKKTVELVDYEKKERFGV